jgi:hypothetical protein
VEEIVGKHRKTRADLGGVLDRFADREPGAAGGSEHQQSVRRTAVVSARCPYCRRYEPRTGQQDHGIDQTKSDVQRRLGCGEQLPRMCLLDYIREEQQAEEGHVDENEDPDSLLARESGSWFPTGSVAGRDDLHQVL